MPEEISECEYQKEVLKEYVGKPYEFIDFGVYDSTTQKCETIMNHEDVGHPNTYLISLALNQGLSSHR